MLKVLFYTQNRWAFGSIHHALIKELYKHSIYANLLDWTQGYTNEEFQLLNNVYDIFVTNPEAVVSLHSRGIPYNKIITIAHGQWDLLLAKEKNGVDFYNELRGYGVISNILKQKSIEFGINRIPNITPLGIHFDMFYAKPNNHLKIVGYAGQKECYNYYKQEIKRAKLVELSVNQISDLQLLSHKEYNHLCMPGYYKLIDCLIMSSIEEAGGLPIMEASASGRLVLGTYVGYFEEYADMGAGIGLPLDENNFIIKTIEHLNYYKDNSIEYKIRCQNIQEFARNNYDWSNVIKYWIQLLV